MFLHRHNIAHRSGPTTPPLMLQMLKVYRDVTAVNIMMDGRALYPHGHHPVRQNFTPDALYEINPLQRAENPVQYYYIDFDLSVRFNEGEPHLVVGDVGREDKVPELSNDIPYDPFKVDIFALGHLYYEEFQEVCYNVLPPRIPLMVSPALHRNIITWTSSGL